MDIKNETNQRTKEPKNQTKKRKLWFEIWFFGPLVQNNVRSNLPCMDIIMHTLWTEEDEVSLLKLKESTIDMLETALGRPKALKKRELKIVATNMTTPEMNALTA